MFDYGGEGQSKWRQDYNSSGLANPGRLANTVRIKRYKNQGGNPAVLIYSTMPKVQAAFDAGATIVVHGKKGALVPNPDVWPAKRVARPSGRGGVTTFQVAVRRFGDLQFVPTPGHAHLVGVFLAKLGATGRRVARRLRNQARNGRIVVFYVIENPRLPRALHGPEIRRRIQANANSRVVQLYQSRFQAGMSGQRLLPGPDQ